jgi:hypothetical protein
MDDPLPVPPGQSPFHVRGLYYARLLSHATKRLGGRARVLSALSPELRAFAEQSFAWTGWYDALPAMPICVAFVRELGLPFEPGVREQTRSAALDIIPSFFRLALRVPGHVAFTAQTERIVPATMDFIELKMERSTETHSSGWGRGVPLFLAPHVANTVVGFFQAILELRTGAVVRARYTDVVKIAPRHGFESVAIRYEFDWDG